MDKDTLLILIPVITFLGVIVTVIIGRWNLTTQLDHQTRHDFEKLRLEKIEEMLQILAESPKKPQYSITYIESESSDQSKQLLIDTIKKDAEDIPRLAALVGIYAKGAEPSFTIFLKTRNKLMDEIQNHKVGKGSRKDLDVLFQEHTIATQNVVNQLEGISENILPSKKKQLIKIKK